MKRLFLLLALATCVTASIRAQETHVKWATFNIRVDLKEDSLNRWAYRKAAFVDYIISNDFDVVGMQEVTTGQLTDLEKLMPAYANVGVSRNNGTRKGELDPIFFRKDRFELLDSNTFWLSEHPDSVGLIGWDAMYPRIATWAKLRDKSTGKVFMAVNTHFDHKGVEARKNSALLIIERIKEIVGSEPAVLTGDFNVNNKSEAYETITTNEFVLRDSYLETEVITGPTYTFHAFGTQPVERRQKIDFIFVTEGVKVLSEHIYQEHAIDPDKPETQWGFLSDHNPVWAELIL